MKHVIARSKTWIALLALAMTLGSCTKSLQKEPRKTKADLSKYLSGDTDGFKKASQIRKFKFPEDHSAHPDYKTEWWYFTGNLDSESDKHYGYQLTIFRSGVYDKETGDIKQIYMGNLGLSDISNDKFYSYEVFQREDMQLAGYEMTKIWLNDWQIKFDNEKIKISSFQEQVGFELAMEAAKPIVFQGNKGLSQKNAQKGNASYYYSIPRLKTSGYMQIKDEKFDVSGESWLDREWSTSALSDKQEGWDWFALQLDDNSELMFYQIRNKDGSVDEYSLGSYVDAKGKKRNVSLNEITIEVLDTWNNYPSTWNLKIPRYDLDLKIKPYIKDQMHKFNISYWEGAVKVSGSHTGKGYVELTGY